MEFIREFETSWTSSRIVRVGVSAVLCQAALTVATKCLRDESLGDAYEANVYHCNEEEKPECCEVDMDATCCETKSGKNFREQFQLWGILGVAIVLVAFVVVCWRKDTYLCEGDTLKDRCRNSCRKRKKGGDCDDSMELRVSKPKSPQNKYNPASGRSPGNSAMSRHRESTAITAKGIEPMFTSSHNEIQISDVDSGRGSVASSASHLTRANEKTPNKSRSLDGNVFVVQPTPEREGPDEKTHNKKHKSKKKSKSKDKDWESDENEVGDSSRKDKNSKKRKKRSRSKHNSNSDEEVEMDIYNV